MPKSERLIRPRCHRTVEQTKQNLWWLHLCAKCSEHVVYIMSEVGSTVSVDMIRFGKRDYIEGSHSHILIYL